MAFVETQHGILNNIHNNICIIICAYYAQYKYLGWAIESFIAVISYWTTVDRARVFNGVIARSKVDDHDAWCVIYS